MKDAHSFFCHTLRSGQDVLNLLYVHAVEAVRDRNQIRSANAMQTLACILRCVFAKRKFENLSFDVINVIMGYDTLDTRFSELVSAIQQILREGRPGGKLKDLALRLLIIITTATTNMTQNVLLEHLMQPCLFGELMRLVERKDERDQLGYNSLLLLGLLMSYRRADHDATAATHGSKIPSAHSTDTAGGWLNPYALELSKVRSQSKKVLP